MRRNVKKKSMFQSVSYQTADHAQPDSREDADKDEEDLDTATLF